MYQRAGLESTKPAKGAATEYTTTGKLKREQSVLGSIRIVQTLHLLIAKYKFTAELQSIRLLVLKLHTVYAQCDNKMIIKPPRRAPIVLTVDQYQLRCNARTRSTGPDSIHRRYPSAAA